jgi:hypothetical protein
MARIIVERAIRARGARISSGTTAPDQPQLAPRSDRSPARRTLVFVAGVLGSLVAVAVLIVLVLQIWVAIPIAMSPPKPETPDDSCAGSVEFDVPTVPDIRGAPARPGPAFTC